MAIVVCGLSHKTAPLDLLEQVSLTSEDLGKAMARLLDFDPIHEGVVLSTCNRMEVYAAVHRFHPAVEAITNHISDVSGAPRDNVLAGMYTYYDADAVRHLFEVASGVDSMVVGETEILGQVRDAFRVATEEGTARRVLHKLFERALRTGKRARTETAIAHHVTSLPRAAARMASDLAGGLDGKRVVILGAGRMGELAARAAQDAGATELVIANRTLDRATSLAHEVGAEICELDRLPLELKTSHVLIGVTSSPDHLVDAAMLAKVTTGRTLVAVDIAVPRDFDPAARDVPGVILRDLEDIQTVVEAGTEARKAELPKVQSIVREEVDGFSAWERSLALGPAIARLREWAEEIRLREVSKLTEAGEVDPADIDRITRDLVGKLLHRPMSRMHELVQDPDGQVYLEAFQEIFDLPVEEGAVMPSDSDGEAAGGSTGGAVLPPDSDGEAAGGSTGGAVLPPVSNELPPVSND